MRGLLLPLLLPLLLLLALPLAAQTTVHIVGSSDNAAGKVVGLYGYTDMLTMDEVLLDSVTVDADGSFSLECYVNYPRLVFLQVENYSQSFYIEAGRTYKVHIAEFDWSVGERQNVYLDPVALPLWFDELPDDELNVRITRFGEVVDSMINARRAEFDSRFRPRRSAFNELEATVNRMLPEADSNSFFARYKRFTLAEMKLSMNFTRRGKLMKEYIEGQPIRYYDEQYMRFFLALFDHSLSRGSRKVPMGRLVSWVDAVDLRTMMDSLGTDPMLKNERVRELVALQAMKEAYYDPDYSADHVREMVEKIARQTKFDEHRQLAERMVEKFVQRESGADMPSTVLPDVERRMVDLATDFEGKWVYVSFVRVNDPNSIGEMEVIAHFHDTLAARCPDLEFVSVSCDREFQKMYHFLKSSKRGSRYVWTWLHFDGNYPLLEQLGVVSYPSFMLIDPEGKQHYSVTPPPSSGLLLHGPWEKPVEEEESILPFGN